MKVVIMQPLYIPWIGYFSLMDLADVFVFYDDVQFEGKYQQRNDIKTANGVQVLSIPIVHNYPQNINEVKIVPSYHWMKDHWKSIEQSYSKAPYFDKYGYVI